MATNKRSRIWWWIIPGVVILGGLGYYWHTKTGPETEKVLIVKETSPARTGDVSEGIQGAGIRTGSSDASAPGAETSAKDGPGVKTFPIEKERTSQTSEVAAQGPIEELFVKADSDLPARETASDQRGYCALIEKQASDFFHSLDTRAYFRRFNLEKAAHPYFAQIIKRLAARPPQPAGEGIEPTTLLANIFFFSRALDRKDLHVIKAVIENETDTMEFDLETFYRWLMLGKECPNPGDVRPPFDVTYRYAGFFLNTTGGRSYLFRRPLRLRLLASYYCVLIIYQADRLGKNISGLDVVPYLQPLKDEMAHHPELEFQDQYISTLNRIRDYYLQRR
jgi:hypothetical protein